MKWLNKRKPVFTQTVFGYPRGHVVDYMAHTHWVNHKNWKRKSFMPGEVYELIASLGYDIVRDIKK